MWGTPVPTRGSYHLIVRCNITESVVQVPFRGNIKMLSSEYCLARAERMRMLMITASDPAYQLRLRGFVVKYRDLAERAKKDVKPRPSADTVV